MGSTASLTSAAAHPGRPLQHPGPTANPGASTTTARVSAVDRFLLVAAAILVVGVAAGVVAGFRLVIVYSSSMTPGIDPGDVVVTRSMGPGEIEVGDVVTFSDPSRDGAVVTHRVVAVGPADRPGEIAVVTRGDRNTTEEHWRIRDDGKVGLRLATIPAAGRLAAWARVSYIRFGLMLLAFVLASWALWSWVAQTPARPAGRHA